MQKRPYNTPDIDAIAAADLAEAGLGNDAEGAIKTIAMVGALTNIHGNQLFEDDRATLVTTVRQLQGAGIAVSQTPRILIYNLLPPVSCDFLQMGEFEKIREEDMAPILIACAVHRIGIQCAEITRFATGYKDVDREAYRDTRHSYYDRLLGVSPWHRLKNIWGQKAAEMGAEIVAARGNLSDELTIEYFTGEERFKPVIRNYEGVSVGTNLKINGGIGFAVAPEFLQQHAPQCRTESRFGQALRRAYYDDLTPKLTHSPAH